MTVDIEKRIAIIVGHYGSGKTEFSVNLALSLAEKERTALLDLDIANPYFRSRERQQFLEERGVRVFSNTFGYDISADLPAVSAAARGPLEDPESRVVVDAGGDDFGARVLIQFKKYFVSKETAMLCVINANRPETRSLEGAVHHICAIESETGIKVSGLVNNTHLLRETRTADIFRGAALCEEVSEKLDIPILYHCCTEELAPAVSLEAGNRDVEMKLFVVKMYMRSNWMDRAGRGEK